MTTTPSLATWLDGITRTRRFRVVVAACWLINLVMLTRFDAWGQQISAKRNYPLDLDVYRAAEEVLGKVPNVYLETFTMADGSQLPYLYPPFSLLVLWPTQFIDLYLLEYLWGGAGLALLTAVIYLLLRRLFPATNTVTVSQGGTAASASNSNNAVPEGASVQPTAPRVTWALAALLVLPLSWLEPISTTYSYGQINLFVMSLVAIDLLRPESRRFPRGILLGVAISLKLTPALFVVWLLFIRHYRTAAWAVVSALVTTALGFLIIPAESAYYWTVFVINGDPGLPLGVGYNLSIPGFLRFVTPGQDFNYRPIVVLVGLGVVYVWWRLRRADAFLGGLFITALAALLVSPVSWNHHWVWIAPLVVALVVVGCRNREEGLIVFALLFLAAGYLVNSQLVQVEYTTGTPSFAQLVGGLGRSSYIWLALGLVIYSGVRPSAWRLAKK